MVVPGLAEGPREGPRLRQSATASGRLRRGGMLATPQVGRYAPPVAYGGTQDWGGFRSYSSILR